MTTTDFRGSRVRAKELPEPGVIEGRVPPHDLDAEGGVLSSVLIDPSAMDKVLEVLLPEHFYSEAHRRIFEACIAVKEQGKPIDTVTVGSHLKQTDRIAQVGGMAYLTLIVNAAPFVANVRAYADRVVEKANVRQGIAICQKAVALGYVDYGSMETLIGDAATALNDILLAATKSDFEQVLGCIKRAIKSAADARGKDGISGAATGFDRYDHMTSGLHEGDLTIIAARPGMGKTSLVLNMAANIAAPPSQARARDCRVGVGVFSLEMPREQLGARMVCCEGKVDVSKMRSGFLSPTDWDKLTKAANFLGVLPIFIDDTPAITLQELRAKVRRMQLQYNGKEKISDEPESDERDKKIGVVIVDYLQLMKGRDGVTSREQEISEISRGLKALAKELHVSVVALSQLNRGPEERKDKRPMLSELRESGAIEQDADNICFIYRDDYYDRNSREKNIAELIIAKQRNGPTGIAKVRFDAEYTRFDNLADGDYATGDDDAN